jgi:7-carboxy-7-deazaguanine synthase (Cx14CxxC type)
VTYTVHEIFLTAQGEGANLGRTAVFIRFAGCNLWSGREEDRATAVCRFCDTEFRGGAKHDVASLVAAAAALWPAGAGGRFAVVTGGEPLLQLDAPLLAALRAAGFTVAIETNGTLALPAPIDWVCVSPKAGAPLALDRADELKLVYPQAGMDPADWRDFPAAQRWLSPMDGPEIVANTAAAAEYCRRHPEWRLNIQAHKTWGVR